MESLEKLKKRLLYQSQHRGTKELDLLLGKFAEKNLPSMTQEEAEKFDSLLALPECELYEWLCNKLIH
jgi:antitoxin CptB